MPKCQMVGKKYSTLLKGKDRETMTPGVMRMNSMKKEGFQLYLKGVRCWWSKYRMGLSTNYDNIMAKSGKTETK